MGKTIRSLLPIVLAAVLFAALGATARAKENPANDCLVGVENGDEQQLSGTITCTDGDSCDSDGATNGSCSFKIRGCLNIPGVAGCSLRPIKKVKFVTPHSNNKIVVTPVAGQASSVCGSFIDLQAPLKKKGKKQKPGKRFVNASAQADAKPAGKNKDKDKVAFVCNPCPTASCVPPTTTTTEIVITTTTVVTTTSTSTTLACGNGVKDANETCDPNATPSGCNSNETCVDCTSCTATCGQLGFKIGPPAFFCGFPGVQDPALGNCSITTATVCENDGQCPVGETCLGFTGSIKDGGGQTVTAGTLAAGCLYIGGGLASIVPPGPTPENSETFFNMTDCASDTRTLYPSEGDDSLSCSLGPKADKKCLNGAPGTNQMGLCTTDSDCAPLCVNLKCSGGSNDGTTCTSNANCTGGGSCLGDCVNGPGNLDGGKCSQDSECGLGTIGGACQRETNCTFGAPLPFVNDPTSTCVINVIQPGAGGTATVSTGNVSVNMPLQSRVYLTGVTYGVATPCPKCVSGQCSGGKRAGQACTTQNSLLTTHDCPPDDNLFLAGLTVNLSPLTTGVATDTAPDGIFCAETGQDDNPPGSKGALGVGSAVTVVENGKPTPTPLSSTPQAMTLASVFCIPAANNTLVDGAANLPGPGATALSGQARLR